MRYGLLSTVAAAALSLSVAGAIAQTSGTGTSGTGTAGTGTGTSGSTTAPQQMPAQNNTSGAGTSAQQGTTTGNQNTTGTAQTQGTTGGQAATTTGSVNISTENRTEVTRVFRSVRTEPVSVNFNVAVGTVVPQTVTTLHTCPSDVVRLINGLPECRYIVVQDKIVLVEPSSRRVVMVIDRQG